MKKILYAVLILFLLSFSAYAAPDYLSEDERAVLDEINLVRTDPAQYAQNYLVPMKGNYKGSEGDKALIECIDALKNTKPVGKLEPSKGMSQAAADHANEQGPTGNTGHTGSNGSSSWDRINKYGTFSGMAGENIAYGYIKARKIVIQLLIDDGIPSRGHRKNLLEKDFNYIGIAIGDHAKYDVMCVLDFAGQYTENDSAVSATETVPVITQPITISSDDIVCSTTLTEKEKRLYDLIMEYRKSKGLPVIPISPSLTFVAHAHARDLAEHPPSGNCNCHSWSVYGDWSSCCYTDDHAQAQCMWDKPKELTDYKGSGFEISTWVKGYNEGLTPETALKIWKNSSGHNAVIINTDVWKDHEWEAIGIGLYGSYGVVWFGERTDVCQPKNNPIKQ